MRRALPPACRRHAWTHGRRPRTRAASGPGAATGRSPRHATVVEPGDGTVPPQGAEHGTLRYRSLRDSTSNYRGATAFGAGGRPRISRPCIFLPCQIRSATLEYEKGPRMRPLPSRDSLSYTPAAAGAAPRSLAVREPGPVGPSQPRLLDRVRGALRARHPVAEF